jgi:predicted acylesterase/phospholipase RssA
MEEKYETSLDRNDLQDIENLVFRGGGAKGLVYAGTLKSLEEQGVLARIRRVAGSSAGAMSAALVACGSSPKLMEEFCTTKRLDDFLDNPIVKGFDALLHHATSAYKFHAMAQPLYVNQLDEEEKRIRATTRARQKSQSIDIKRTPFTGTLGSYGTKLIEAMDDAINKAILDRNKPDGALLKTLEAREGVSDHDKQRVRIILSNMQFYGRLTFADLATLSRLFPETFKELYVTGTLKDEGGKLRIFSHETDPEMYISDAVRLSASFPVAFLSVNYRDKCCLLKQEEAPNRNDLKQLRYSHYILTPDCFYYFDLSKNLLKKLTQDPSKLNSLRVRLIRKNSGDALESRHFDAITSITGHKHPYKTYVDGGAANNLPIDIFLTDKYLKCGFQRMSRKPSLASLARLANSHYILTESGLFYYDKSRHQLEEIKQGVRSFQNQFNDFESIDKLSDGELHQISLMTNHTHYKLRTLGVSCDDRLDFSAKKPQQSGFFTRIFNKIKNHISTFIVKKLVGLDNSKAAQEQKNRITRYLDNGSVAILSAPPMVYRESRCGLMTMATQPTQDELNDFDSSRYILTPNHLYYYNKQLEQECYLQQIELSRDAEANHEFIMTQLRRAFPGNTTIDRLSGAQLQTITSLTGHKRNAPSIGKKTAVTTLSESVEKDVARDIIDAVCTFCRDQLTWLKNRHKVKHTLFDRGAKSMFQSSTSYPRFGKRAFFEKKFDPISQAISRVLTLKDPSKEQQTLGVRWIEIQKISQDPIERLVLFEEAFNQYTAPRFKREGHFSQSVRAQIRELKDLYLNPDDASGQCITL